MVCDADGRAMTGAAVGTEPSFAEKFQHAEFAEDRRGR